MSKERNYGIDLLRIISMLFIIILHCLGNGGVLDNAVVNSSQYKFAWFMEIFAYCAVNIFALISGYVSYNGENRKTNYSKYIILWLQVVFYGILVTFIFNIVRPELVTKRDYLITLFPVSNGLYWYFTAYTGLFVLIPFINKAIVSADEKMLRKMFVAIIFAFSMFDVVVKRFMLSGGYSVIWIVLLYILGSIMKKCEIGKNVKTYQAVIGIFILTFITYIYKIYGLEITKLNVSITKALLVSYTSPTILGIAILYIIGFSKINFNNVLKKLIKFFAPATFAVYLLNNQGLIWVHIMKDRFVYLCDSSLLKIFVDVMVFSCAFVVGSMLIDRVRILLFKICHIDKFAKKVEEVADMLVTKVSELI